MKNDVQDIHWRRVRFKAHKVWLATRPDGQAVMQNGKMLIKYQLDQDHEYWVLPQNIQALKADSPEAQAPPSTVAPKSDIEPASRPKPKQPDDLRETVKIYTDGASSGNPGPAGIGVLLRYGTHEKEISRFIGAATNNVAELEAIKVGLGELKDTRLPVRLYTDSAYAHGVLTLGWKAKKNQALIGSIKARMADFQDLKLIKVKGHAGDRGNERADRLATSAIKQGSG